MKLVLVLLFSTFLVELCGGQVCKDIVLQEDLDINEITGNWSQLFYSPGSIYEGIDCYHLHVTERDADSLRLVYHFTLKELPDEVIEFSKNQERITDGEKPEHDGDSRDEEEVHVIENHLASDYENFLILYSCTEETGIMVDVQIKQGVRKLGREVRAKMNKSLRKLGMKIKDLTRVPFRYCDKKNIP